MNIDVKQVKELRRATGFSIMGCKKALVEAEGDMKKAIKILKLKGLKKIEKKNNNETHEGMVCIYKDGKHKILMNKVVCETEATAKSFETSELGFEILAQKTEQRETDIENHAMKFGEKIIVSETVSVTGDYVDFYHHHNGKLGVIIGIQHEKGKKVKEKYLKQISKDLCYVIASNKPIAIDVNDLEKNHRSFIKEETSILKERLRGNPKYSEKPEKVIKTILEGQKNKIYKECCLLEQDWLTGKYANTPIKNTINNDAVFGSKIKVLNFKIMEIK